MKFLLSKHAGWMSSTLVACALSFVAAGCDSKAEQPTPPATTTPAPVKHEPTAERLIERSGERWKAVCKADWIAAYEFQSPEYKKSVPLAQYLQGKATHTYANAKVRDVVKLDGEKAYLRTSSVWTPKHPSIDKLPPEQRAGVTQELVMIETWTWSAGDWTYGTAEEESKFFEAHPDFLKTAK